MSDDANRTETPPAEDRWASLWRRVNDHKLVQWTVAYVALAYGIQHGVTLTAEAFEWPHAVERVSMLLLVLGLPVMMTLAWYHGARAARHFSRAELSILSVLLVIGAFLFYTFAQPTERLAETAARPPQVQAGELSIAVLPFANLSGDPAQEFFSDGMTDEIITALTKVPALRVVGRESAFQFKGQKLDMRAVSQALGSNYLIEGSVRAAGGRVRISAQLTRADNSVNLWAESYDRESKDMFAIQADIAQAIAAALRLPLGLREGATAPKQHSPDLEAYRLYLQGRAARRSGNGGSGDAVATLETAVARDPAYAPAWAMLSLVYRDAVAVTPAYRNGSPEELRRAIQAANDNADRAAQKAIDIDPRFAGGYNGLAGIQVSRGKWVEAEDSFRQALALDPFDPETIGGYRYTLATLGRLKEALRMSDQLHMLEPFVPRFNLVNAIIQQLNGQYESSIPALEAVPVDNNLVRNARLAKAYAVLGRFRDAADIISAINDTRVDEVSVKQAAQLIRAPSPNVKPRDLPRLDYQFNFIYAYVGALDRSFDVYERAVEAGDSAILLNVWDPVYATLRKTERFKSFAHKAGFLDYWKARGWPDLCHPVGADDFVCD